MQKFPWIVPGLNQLERSLPASLGLSSKTLSSPRPWPPQTPSSCHSPARGRKNGHAGQCSAIWVFFRILKELHGQQANLFCMKHLMSLTTSLCCLPSGLMAMKVPSRLAVVKKADGLASVGGCKEQPWWFLTYDQTVHHSRIMGQQKQLISEKLEVRDEGRRERLYPRMPFKDIPPGTFLPLGYTT